MMTGSLITNIQEVNVMAIKTILKNTEDVQLLPVTVSDQVLMSSNTTEKLTDVINDINSSINNIEENVNNLEDTKLDRSPTLLWQGSVSTINETITLSQPITNFTLIYFTATNESGEMYSQVVLSSDLQQTNGSNFYNIANSHSNVARYINLYQNGNTNLTIGGAENLTLNKVYGF